MFLKVYTLTKAVIHKNVLFTITDYFYYEFEILTKGMYFCLN